MERTEIEQTKQTMARCYKAGKEDTSDDVVLSHVSQGENEGITCESNDEEQTVSLCAALVAHECELAEITCSSEQEEEQELIKTTSTLSLLQSKSLSISGIVIMFQYFVVGFISGTLNGLLYGILVGTMALDTKKYVTSQAVIVAPWGMKCVVGFLSDHSSSKGYKRRSYCTLGHLIVCFTFCGLSMFYTAPMSKYCEQKEDSECDQFIAKDTHVIIICFMIICFGLVLSEAACDGLLVETSQSQITRVKRMLVPVGCFAIRIIGTTATSAIFVFGFNGETQSGFFSSGIPLWTLFATCAILSLLAGLLWWNAPYDTAHAHWHSEDGKRKFRGPRLESAAISHKFSVLFRFFSTRPFCNFMLYNLLAPILVNTTSPVAGLMGTYWTQTDRQQVTFLASSVTTLMLLAVMMTWFLKSDWPTVVLLTTTGTACLSLPISVFAALDICRHRC